jgi:hypothetical protein
MSILLAVAWPQASAAQRRIPWSVEALCGRFAHVIPTHHAPGGEGPLESSNHLLNPQNITKPGSYSSDAGKEIL